MECEGKQLQEAATNVIETRPILLSTSRESTISGKVSALGIMNTLHFSRRIFIHSMEFAQQLIISLLPHKCVLTALKPLPVLIARCTCCGSILSLVQIVFLCCKLFVIFCNTQKQDKKIFLTMDKIKIYHVWGILALKFISLRFKLSPIIHCMKRFIVLEFVKEIFCDLEIS